MNNLSTTEMMNIKVIPIAFFVISGLFLASCDSKTQNPISPVKSASSQKGMVVSAHVLASEVGLDILKRGGNAAEAAIAVQFALAVVYPSAGNIGGGGFLVYRDQEGEVTALDYREKAPMAATRDMYLDSAKNIVPDLSFIGVLAAGVPGSVAGLEETYKKFGSTIPWNDLVEPAILLAENGFPLTKLEAEELNMYRSGFLAENSVEIPFLSDVGWKEGDLLVQKELAATLRLIASNGRDGFYKGANAEAIVTLMQEKNGIITKQDLADYKSVWRQPIVNNWREYEIYSMGLPSSGGIVLGQILKMIDPLLVDSLGANHPQNIHLVVEAERRAYADRAKYLGDSDHFPVDFEMLLSPQYLKDKMSSYDASQSTPSNGFIEGMQTIAKEHYETTHLSIMDQYGNAASVTTTLNGGYGCRVWVPNGGYFLNNEMDDFSAKPGVPNEYGLIGGEANAIAAGKRMLSSMTPTILEKDGKPFMVVGTPGGSTIITSVLQAILNVTCYSMTVDSAVQYPRYHHQWFPDEVIYEKNNFNPSAITELESKGHLMRPVSSIGYIEAILVDEQGVMHGAADGRGEDHAAGW